MCGGGDDEIISSPPPSLAPSLPLSIWMADARCCLLFPLLPPSFSYLLYLGCLLLLLLLVLLNGLSLPSLPPSLAPSFSYLLFLGCLLLLFLLVLLDGGRQLLSNFFTQPLRCC